jgi:IQ calmodulin-binding motif
VSLQSVTRSYQCREHQQGDVMNNHLCAKQIQTCWRQHHEMKKHRSLQSSLIQPAIVRDQQCSSGTAESKNETSPEGQRSDESSDAKAVVLLQSSWRRHHSLEEFQRTRDSAILLQSFTRRFQSRAKLSNRSTE